MMSSLRAIVFSLLAWARVCHTADAQPPGIVSGCDRQTKATKPTHAEWVRAYGDDDFLGDYRDRGSYSGKNPPWVTIIAFGRLDGTEVPEANNPDRWDYRRGNEITADGTLRSFRVGHFGMKGGWNRPSSDLLRRVTPLIRKLPEDNKTVPPVERCVVVRIEDKQGIRIFLYDMADAPEPPSGMASRAFTQRFSST